ncbi:HTH-type transcriptional regulator CynR [Castellaniella defragrans]
MDLRVLRYFVAIADAGSITAAASRVCIAQSALSRHIRELESELGVTLIRRLPRGVRLTAAGAALYQSATRMLEEASRVRSLLADRENLSDLNVIVGTSPTLARVLVPGLIERCGQSPTGLMVTVKEAFTPMLLEWLHRRLIDVAIVTNPDPDEPLSLRPILGEPFALVSPASQGRGPVVTPEDLSRIPVILTSLHRRIIERQLSQLGARLRIQSVIDSVESIRQLVLKGRYATIMPVSVFASDASIRRAVTLSEVSGIPLSRILTLATRNEPRPSPGVVVLRELILAEFTALAARGVFSVAQRFASGQS